MRFIYKIRTYSLNDHEEVEKKLDGLGDDGWELIYIESRIYITKEIFVFKKRVVDNEK